MFWERNKGLIIIGLIWIIVSVPVLILLCPKVGEMIQAEAIITLVFITMFYARQTQELVKREELSLEEGKKKRTADFLRERLTEFYLPLYLNLIHIESVVKFKPFLLEEWDKTISELLRILSKRYMLKQELSESLVSLMYTFKPIETKIEPEEDWISEMAEKAKELREKIDIEIRIIEYKINEVYGFSYDEKLQKFIERLKVEYNLKGK